MFHIRAKRMDLCFELATRIMSRIDSAVSTVDEVHGFRYFDDRDLLGFVDGTENPRGEEVFDATLIGAEDSAFAGGSYVIVQKYLHDLAAWNALSTEAQERIIGRTKLSNIELDDAVKPTSAHNALTTIVEDGEEKQILRDNMPFGQAGPAGEDTGSVVRGNVRPVVQTHAVVSFGSTPTSGQYSQGPGTQRKTSPATATWQTDGNDR
jgi:putative iron-dependent peroxidase